MSIKPNLSKHLSTQHTPKTEKEKLAKQRKEIISNGRKFKYPMQYAKHRLVIIATTIGSLALILAITVGALALYRWQDTGDVLYRLTKILPVPVAKINGLHVRYSDYLMIYRSNIIPVEQQSGTLGANSDTDGMKNYYKRAALTKAEDYTYIMSLAKDLSISVSEKEITQTFDSHRKTGGIERSKESFLKVINDNFGMSESEYRRMLQFGLLQQKVSERIDIDANKTAEKVRSLLATTDNLQEIANQLGQSVIYEETGGLVSILNVDGGRADAATQLETDKVSSQFTSSNGDGYYFVKLVKKTEKEVEYQSLKVPFSALQSELEKIHDGTDGSIKEYIQL